MTIRKSTDVAAVSSVRAASARWYHSTLSVHPAASVPLAAAERGVPYAIVNRGDTDHDGHAAVALRVEGDVVETFPPAVAAALGDG